MKTKVSPYEAETIVNYSKDDNVAYVYTANQSDINKFTKLGYKCVFKDSNGAKFETDKKNISFRSAKGAAKDKPKRTLSEEHLEKLKKSRGKANG